MYLLRSIALIAGWGIAFMVIASAPTIGGILEAALAHA